jgi:probable addiction module antidote protein
MKLIDFDDAMAAHLRDPQYAAALLEECLSGEDGPAAFLRALRAIVKAQTNMSEVAREMEASRSSLYRSLSENGNPELKTLMAVLDLVGLQLTVTPKRELQNAA